jgi:hypothetical protein
MLINEIFNPYLNYAMFGWISPTGVIKMATPSHAQQDELVDHISLEADLGLGSDYSDAFEKRWVRWGINGDRLFLECWWTPGVKATISRGVRSILKLCENPNKFRHFAIKPAGNNKPNQAHNDMIIIKNYSLETPDGYWQGSDLRTVLNQADQNSNAVDPDDQED